MEDQEIEVVENPPPDDNDSSTSGREKEKNPSTEGEEPAKRFKQDVDSNDTEEEVQKKNIAEQKDNSIIQQKAQQEEQVSSPNTKKVIDHESFIKSLENCGTAEGGIVDSSHTWDVMAKELGCSVEEVEEYAYKYLISIVAVPREKDSSFTPSNNNNVSAGLIWTAAETILFETLLLQYKPPKSKRFDTKPWNEWGESIAQKIPGKKKDDVITWYNRHYLNTTIELEATKAKH
eukprot:CAMPEP_0178929988 /NCGR_PEP_ID=MMETSP0786-20121207/20961_1 /TAXON_ID=186022 /ORGANISM="Thalassionema frauenfeldii, Strain CCMP 1798" /LENGTH=232 /DNA_ID=CAMNT_0020606417 /DNA_START=143 /DNA_END=841 /DNA_ORIENTATION=+